MKYLPTAVVEIKNELTKRSGIRLFMKLEYQNHPVISGNKFWKLKYNIQDAITNGFDTVLTFGGAFSNHIYATAACCNEHQLRSIGVIRGERILPLNKTLSFAEANGMQLHFVSREKYKLKTGLALLDELRDKFGNYFTIPEGGTNLSAIKGCEEFAKTELIKIDFDHLFLPVGTGGTIAGIISGFKGSRSVKGISVLKNGEFLKDDVHALIKQYSDESYGNWDILTNYDHGGYAKMSSELNAFISDFYLHYNIPLDHVYTGKMMWAIMREIESGKFERGSTIFALHTGGLQAANLFQ